MADDLSPGLKVGVAWYSEAEWERLRELAADPEILEETYAEWRSVYESGVRKLAASGLAPEPVGARRPRSCKPGALSGNAPIDASARAEFVSEILMRRSKQDPPSSRFPRFWRE